VLQGPPSRFLSESLAAGGISTLKSIFFFAQPTIAVSAESLDPFVTFRLPHFAILRELKLTNAMSYDLLFVRYVRRYVMSKLENTCLMTKFDGFQVI